MGWLRKAQSLLNSPFFFEILIFPKKDTVFCKFQRSHLIGGLNVDASVGKGGKLGGGGAEDD